MLAAKGFRSEPANFIYHRHINYQNVNLAFVVWAVFVFLDLLPKVDVNSASSAEWLSIRLLDLRAIEFAVSFDDVIVSGAFKDRLADERADLQSAHTDFHHCDLSFSDLIGEHVFEPPGSV